MPERDKIEIIRTAGHQNVRREKKTPSAFNWRPISKATLPIHQKSRVARIREKEKWFRLTDMIKFFTSGG
jgi:hypothetical protein